MVCPECGQHDSVLQSVVSNSYECRIELGGCGAAFAQPAMTSTESLSDLRTALESMLNAICSFESRDLTRNLSHDDPERKATDDLLKTLRQQIASVNANLH